MPRGTRRRTEGLTRADDLRDEPHDGSVSRQELTQCGAPDSQALAGWTCPRRGDFPSSLIRRLGTRQARPYSAAVGRLKSDDECCLGGARPNGKERFKRLTVEQLTDIGS
jgi:hypothetical protein